MTRLLKAFAFIAVAVICAMPMQLLAQAADTLDVAALPAGNINTVIGGDTLVGNLRAHPNRVYRLKRTSVYQITAPMRIKGNIKIVATDGTTRPPVLAPAILADNSSVDTFFDLIGKGSNVEMSNVYMLSVRSDQAQLGWSTAIQVNADSIAMKLRGVVFDAFSSSCIRQFGRWSKLDVQDCIFRNSQHSSSWFGGQPFLSDSRQMDTCKFINNTFFANNSYIWTIRGYDRLSIFSHNTIVYSIVNPFLNARGYNMHMNNNLFYGAHSFGGNPVHIIEDWMNAFPDSTQSSIILLRAKTETVSGPAIPPTTIKGVEALIDSAHGVTADMVPVAGRVVEIKNNTYLFPPKLVNFVKAYNDTVKTVDTLYGKVYKHTIAMARWMNDYELTHVNPDLLSLSPKSAISNNSEVDPGFNSTIVNFCDSVNAYCQRISTDKLDRTWLFNPNGNLYPPVWPIPENLAYTNTTMQKGGTDGFAIGDLNWFPTQKAQWLTTGVETMPDVTPAKFELGQNYPNPFNPSTQINFSLTKASVTTLKVYNVIGQEVATLVNEMVPAGSHFVKFDASKLSSGVYFYTLRAGNFVESKKMMLMK